MKLSAYWNEVMTEIRKVEWPSRAQTIRMTAVVVGASILVAGYIAISDAGLGQIMAQVITWSI